MTKEVYNKAERLQNDIELITIQLRKNKENRYWITIATPYMKEARGSEKFQEELVEWLEQKLKEYQKEFDELGCDCCDTKIKYCPMCEKKLKEEQVT